MVDPVPRPIEPGSPKGALFGCGLLLLAVVAIALAVSNEGVREAARRVVEELQRELEAARAERSVPAPVTPAARDEGPIGDLVRVATPPGEVVDLAPTPEGGVLVVTKYSVVRFPAGGGAGEVLLDGAGYRAAFGRPIQALSVGLAGGEGTWAGSWYGELLHHDGSGWAVAVERGTGPRERVRTLVAAGAALWLGGDGLWLYGGGELRELPVLERDTVHAFLQHGGALLIGTDRGLLRTAPDGLERLWPAAVRSLASAPDGGILVGTQDGLALLDASGRVVWHELPGRAVRAAAATPDGAVWAGIWGGGVLVREPGGEWRRLGPHHPLPGPDVMDLALDDAGRLWIGLYGGGLVHGDPAALRAGAVPLE